MGHEISFALPEPAAVMLILKLHPSCAKTVRRAERFEVKPQTPCSEYIDRYGNRCGRLFAPAGRLTLSHDVIVEDSGEPDRQVWNAQQHPVQELPDEALLFLLPSRYCEVDSELRKVAYDLFGQTAPSWTRVIAICNFVHGHIKFDYMQARANRTAVDVYQERKGVCRDYMHLAITFCRIMNIPARYCTGYLGDIGVPSRPPDDFSAWFEVYLGGEWHAFDARNNIPRIGRILMGRGRDAADVALTTIFGLNELASFNVWAYVVPETEIQKVFSGPISIND